MIIQSFFYALLLLLSGYGIVSLLGIKMRFDSREQFLYSILIGTVILVLVPFLWSLLRKITRIIPLVFFISAVLTGISLYTLTRKMIHHFASESTKVAPENTNRWSERVLLVSVAGLLAGILFLQVTLPLRGYDATWMYFTSAYVIYLQDSIPLVNYLTFQPLFKEPALLLLYADSIYLTSDYSLIALPFLFTCGNAVIVYRLMEEFTEKQQLRLFAVLIYLIMPFTKWLVDNWAYYQDLYLEFFFGLTVFLFLKLMSEEQKTKMFAYTVMTGLAFALSLLMKINGLSLVAVLLLLSPLPRKVEKHARSMLVVLFAIIFWLFAATKIFIGLGLPVAVYAVIILFSGVRYYSNALDRWKAASSLSVIVIGLGLGLTWLVELRSRLPGVFDGFVVERYFSLGSAMKNAFPSLLGGGGEIHLEIMHGVNFWTSSFLFFLGTFFTTFWLMPKIYGLTEANKMSPVIIWLFSYLVIWTAYFANGSLRYLSPVQVPAAILVAFGIFKIWEIHKKSDSPPIHYLLTWCFLACLNYYYLVSPGILLEFQESVNRIGEAFNQAGIWYNGNPLVLLLTGAVPAGLLLVYFKYSSNLDGRLFQRKRFKQAFILVLIAVIITVPIAVPAIVLITVNFDVTEYQQVYVHDSRLAVQEVVDAIVQDNQPKSGILAVNFPNLAFLTQQPVIDLYKQKEAFQPIFDSQNATEALALIQDPLWYIEQEYQQEVAGFEELEQMDYFQVKYIVIPRSGHYWYHYYKQDLYKETYFFRMLNNDLYFKLLFNNSEFSVYQPIFKGAVFTGIVDVFFTDGNSQSSILRVIEEDTAFDKSPELKILLDLQMLEAENVTITARANITLNTGKFQSLDINTTIEPESFTELNLGKMPLNFHCLNWLQINITRFQGEKYTIDSCTLHPIDDTLKFTASEWFISSGTGFIIEK
ncbi:MAG: hypothetical protein ACFFD4_00550 [Candidatus Odinarchaeota archaeon]